MEGCTGTFFQVDLALGQREVEAWTGERKEAEEEAGGAGCHLRWDQLPHGPPVWPQGWPLVLAVAIACCLGDVIHSCVPVSSSTVPLTNKVLLLGC